MIEVENTNSELLSFLNRYIPKKINSVVAVTVVSFTFGPSFSILEHSPQIKKYWKIEVVCKPHTLDECTQFQLLEVFPKFIKLFGEICDSVDVNVLYLD